VVVRRGWRAIAAVLLVTMVLPVLLLSGLTAACVAVGAGISPHGKGTGVVLVAAIFTGPAFLVLAVGCGLVVARGWTGAVWAAATAGSGRPAGIGDALRWSRRRSSLLWGSYMIGVAVLAGAAFLAGYAAPGAFTVPDLWCWPARRGCGRRCCASPPRRPGAGARPVLATRPRPAAARPSPGAVPVSRRWPLCWPW
jgi:lysylphosphatidylglycerol synthetase-like protein (DUF2156 family)